MLPKFRASFIALSLSCIGLVVFSLCGCKGPKNAGQNPGEVAPDISGTGLSGEPVSLSSYPGKVVVLNFWATWCGPCVEELPALERVYEKLKDSGLVVIGVAIDDTPGDVLEYKNQYKITYPLIIDHTGLSKRSYGIQGVPETFILDSKRNFIMMTDPQDLNPVTRFIGPREWDSQQVVKMFTDIINKNS